VAPSFLLDEKPDCVPECGTVHHVAATQTREIFRRAAKPVPETEVEDSGVELLSLEEREEGTKNSRGWPWTTAASGIASQSMPFGNALVERPFGAGHTRVLARDECL
jgi:hypothetical protein